MNKLIGIAVAFGMMLIAFAYISLIFSTFVFAFGYKWWLG